MKNEAAPFSFEYGAKDIKERVAYKSQNASYSDLSSGVLPGTYKCLSVKLDVLGGATQDAESS